LHEAIVNREKRKGCIAGAYIVAFASVQPYGIIEVAAVKDPLISSGIETLRIRHRRGVRVLAMGLVLLGLCVFAWGLRYKLSLYQPPHSVGTHMPAAKLLAGKERIALPAVNLRRATSTPAVPFVVGLWSLVLFLPMLLRQWTGSRAWGWLSARTHFLPDIGRSAPSSVRPPPCTL